LVLSSYRSSHVASSHVAILHALSFLLQCCFSHVAAPLVLLFFMRCHSFRIVAFLALLFSHCYSRATTMHCSFYVAIPLLLPLLALLFLLHCYFHHATPFMLLFPSHYSFQTIAHFKYLLIQPLLFFLCCCCYSFRATTLFCLVSMVFPQPLPCVSQSTELWH
jgi:hypothetical protein